MKHGDLGANVESHSHKVTDPPIDVHRAASGQRKLSTRVATVGNREQGWGQERRLALTAMCVTGQNPARVVPHPG